MRVPNVRTTITAAAAILLLGACTASASPGGSDAAPSGVRAPAPNASAGDLSASSTAVGGSATTAACGLLTVEEIQQATGFAVNPGVLQNSDGQSDCEWASTQSDTQSVGLTVSTYQDFLWQAGSGSTLSSPVSGIGDAAYKGYPHNGVLNVKAKGYQVVVAIIDFQATQEMIDAADLAMAKLVLPRL
jgi:hypothetical protein